MPRSTRTYLLNDWEFSIINSALWNYSSKSAKDQDDEDKRRSERVAAEEQRKEISDLQTNLKKQNEVHTREEYDKKREEAEVEEEEDDINDSQV